MLPSEMVILMAIAVNKNSGKQLLTRPMDVTGEYLGYLCDSLVTRGYLKKHRTNDYQLTPAGRESIAAFLKTKGNKTREVMKRLQFLGIDATAHKKSGAKLEKEARSGNITGPAID